MPDSWASLIDIGGSVPLAASNLSSSPSPRRRSRPGGSFSFLARLTGLVRLSIPQLLVATSNKRESRFLGLILAFLVISLPGAGEMERSNGYTSPTKLSCGPADRAMVLVVRSSLGAVRPKKKHRQIVPPETAPQTLLEPPIPIEKSEAMAMADKGMSA